MKPHPHPNVQIPTLPGMGLDQSYYLWCRAKLHLEPFFAVTVFMVQTNKLFAFVNHPGNPQPSVLYSCIMLSAVTRTEQSRGPQALHLHKSLKRGEQCRGEGKWGWEGNVQLAAICYQKWKSSASQSFLVLSFGNKSIIFFILELKLSSSHSITYPWQVPLGCSPKRCVTALLSLHYSSPETNTDFHVFSFSVKKNKKKIHHAKCTLKQLL